MSARPHEGLPEVEIGRAPVAVGLGLGRRRAFLVNPRHQLRAGALAVLAVLVLLVPVNVLLYSAGSASSARVADAAPELEVVLRAQDRVELILVVLASLVFLVGCFLIAVLETHRTAGAAHNVAARLAEVAHGRYTTTLRLRRGDTLVELEPAFAAMTAALRARCVEDLQRLERAADELVAGTVAPAEVARSLREHAARRRAELS